MVGISTQALNSFRACVCSMYREEEELYVLVQLDRGENGLSTTDQVRQHQGIHCRRGEGAQALTLLSLSRHGSSIETLAYASAMFLPAFIPIREYHTFYFLSPSCVSEWRTHCCAWSSSFERGEITSVAT